MKASTLAALFIVGMVVAVFYEVLPVIEHLKEAICTVAK